MFNNLAQDYSAWLWMGKCFILIALLFWIGLTITKIVQIEKLERKNFRDRILKNKLFWYLTFKIAVFFITIAALFIFFGPGKTIKITAANEDGHRNLVQAHEISTESMVELEAKENDDAYLKAVDKDPTSYQKEANNYIEKLLERNKK